MLFMYGLSAILMLFYIMNVLPEQVGPTMAGYVFGVLYCMLLFGFGELFLWGLRK